MIRFNSVHLAAGTILLAASTSMAYAGIHLDVGIGLPGLVPPPVYYGPPPVYYRPPPPVYYGPGVVYGGGWGWNGDEDGRGWAHDRWHGGWRGGGDWHGRGEHHDH